MAFEQRPGTGSLFVNKKKRPDKRDPDYEGKLCLPSGEVHYFKAWQKTDTSGQIFFSCQVGMPVAAAVVDSDEGIPF